jgi:hypothetical protein
VNVALDSYCMNQIMYEQLKMIPNIHCVTLPTPFSTKVFLFFAVYFQHVGSHEGHQWVSVRIDFITVREIGGPQDYVIY